LLISEKESKNDHMVVAMSLVTPHLLYLQLESVLGQVGTTLISRKLGDVDKEKFDIITN
jgi:hypothetical protein